jgi:hypothetical protein
MCAIRMVGLLLLLLTAGCVGVERAPPPTPDLPGEVEAVSVAPPAKPPAGESVTKTEAPGIRTPAAPPASSIPAEPPRKKSNATPSPGKPAPPPAPALDLTALEKRLKETKAIGVFTKLTLKNQVDDLLDQFRAYYQGRVKTTLTELRQPYDRLLLKVLSLCQDGDPELAREIVTSREAIWGILADPVKFATL